MNRTFALLFASAVIWAFLTPIAWAEVSIEEAGVENNYTKNQNLSGIVSIFFNEYIRDAFLNFLLDGTSRRETGLSSYIGNTSSYSFLTMPFRYNLSASGVNTWKKYPTETFYFSIKANSTCNGAVCIEQASETYGSVAKSDGLKFIINGADLIGPITNEDVRAERVWSIVPNPSNPPNIRLTMRKECGRGNYSGIIDTDGDGWYIKNLVSHYLVGTKAVFLMEPFDGESISTQRNLFGGNGGIYKNGQLVREGIEWNGATGNINITSGFDPRARYSIVFLLPNGPKLCAYTNSSVSEYSTWSKTITLEGSTSYTSPYNETIPLDVLNNLVPACPANTYECSTNMSNWNWEAYVIDEPQRIIDFSFDPATRRAFATTTQMQLARRYDTKANLSDIGLNSAESGLHTLLIVANMAGRELARRSVQFNVCEDADGDGFCIEHGDCMDNNSAIYPSAPELCNSRDDNCNGLIDEDFLALGRRKGDSCGIGMCVGILVCSSDGRNLTCSSVIEPGDFDEICNNGLDDNCNGEIDEEDITVNGTPSRCICRSGEKRRCGINKGKCREGYSLCVAGKWSKCIDSTEPTEEVCNAADDDCNGIVDDVNGGGSAEAAKCQCFGGASPTTEKCNAVDDDCDGYIDNGIACCKPGEARPCGQDAGICRAGISRCIDGGWSACTGAVSPMPEDICYNNLDDNCNGETDEVCLPEDTCKNGFKDLNEDGIDCGGPCRKRCEQPTPFIIGAVVVIIVIVAVAVLQMKGLLFRKEKREKTLGEEMGEV